ncbi:MAG: SDR family NAD(P)-dependent oxidoreductase [Pseudomonadota bacterium]
MTSKISHPEHRNPPFVAVVTGGVKGIGLGVAEAVVRRGGRAALTYRNDDHAAAEAEKRLADLGGQVLLLKGDAGDPAVVALQHRQVVEKFGPVTVLVNNAGVMQPAAFDRITIESWDETIRVNLSSAFYWSSVVVPGMKAAGFGRIINVSSAAARGGGVIGPHYAASKAGMLGLTRYAARDLGPFGITVNALAPAFIEDAGIFAGWGQDQLDGLKEKVVTPRLGRVEDVVRAFEYLLDSPFVTGVTLDVCGGHYMN